MLREDGFLEPIIRAHLAPLAAAQPNDAVGSVASLVASDNNNEAPPVVAGARPAATREQRMEVVRRANAGLSNW
eukprot:241593-Prymnesium_polylepis.1